ncbi:hypothetical protein F5Y14DRAFT_431492 [Nemania sp. NC0429]|nr:hypothetical protein F5Y14DRAFT_431492 [Nemania sp. NC0429]
MAELPADSPDKGSNKPMTTEVKVAQPQRTDTTSASREEDMAHEVEDVANSAGLAPLSENEANESPGEGPGIHNDPVTGEVEGTDTRGEAKEKRKKTRRSKKVPKSRRGITGFEEFYADAPMTPAEAVETQKLYHPARPFSDRIEECIQRFRARRRLGSERAALFNKYLFLGGIDSSQRQFTGMSGDRDAMTEADTEQIRNMTAVDFVGSDGSRFYDRNHPEDWDIDFTEVVKAFFSRSITDWSVYEEDPIELAANLIKNFLNYVLMHDVCPEYARDVVAARRICDIAPTELRHTHELMLELPGTFNRAARSLFCERQVDHLDQEENLEALVQFRLTILLWSSSKKTKMFREKIVKALDPTTIEVISTTDEMYQILEIERPRQKDKERVREQLETMEWKGKLKPAGFIRVVPTIIAHGWGNRPRPDEVDFSDVKHEEFVLEDEFLAKLEVGMKIHITACELNIGLRFIMEIHEVHVSFDTFLPQHLMTSWKDPVPNERPPPSIHDPNAEERALDTEMAADD